MHIRPYNYFVAVLVGLGHLGEQSTIMLHHIMIKSIQSLRYALQNARNSHMPYKGMCSPE